MQAVTTARKAIRKIRSGCKIGLTLVLAASVLATGCAQKTPQYGIEQPIFSPLRKRQVWAVAPTVNLSGQNSVDALLQSDLVYQQLQQVQGLTVVPVDRVVQIYAALKIDAIQSEAQADLICDLLGCDGLIVPTVTNYDAYDPPKLGASLQLFIKPSSYIRPTMVSPHEMVRQSAPAKEESLPATAHFFQSVGMFDAANGSVRSALLRYATGRNDPVGPYAAREYFVNMDRYCGFVYCLLISDLLDSPRLKRTLG